MRYALAILVIVSFLGCSEKLMDDPVTAASGVAFISSHIPLPREVITAEEVVASNKPTNNSECSGIEYFEYVSEKATRQINQ